MNAQRSSHDHSWAIRFSRFMTLKPICVISWTVSQSAMVETKEAGDGPCFASSY